LGKLIKTLMLFFGVIFTLITQEIVLIILLTLLMLPVSTVVIKSQQRINETFWDRLLPLQRISAHRVRNRY
jgi:hypothetical protein